MKNATGLTKVLLVALAIPAIGFAVSFFIINDMSKGLEAEGMPDVTILCDAVRTGKLGSEASAELSGACQQVANIGLLGQGSIVAAIIGVFIPVLVGISIRR